MSKAKWKMGDWGNRKTNRHKCQMRKSWYFQRFFVWKSDAGSGALQGTALKDTARAGRHIYTFPNFSHLIQVV